MFYLQLIYAFKIMQKNIYKIYQVKFDFKGDEHTVVVV